jgi:hypothetical protein
LDVATDLDRLIERRAPREPDPDEREESYVESVRRFNAKLRRRNRAEWFSHFCRMAASHRKLSEDYERRAEELCKEGAA